ncbi:hypothetical protein ABW09_00260 [Pluralibacter gergoviae]|uniref:flagellar export chaperone FlgN n=2 Tax=Pluralibacter gergoviae TaxID=61647 RepID=UPI000650C3EF|nr:flagellar export chaperone FlgN [Pluralibacter gergoviae]KMK19917.1 hypothetical protein ABW09_00260 [Pluralibacter gergoviae]
MSSAASQVKMLIQDTADDRRRYISLRSLLEEQRAHILAQRTGDLNAVNDRIMGIYQQLTESSRRRHRLLSALGIAASAYGMQTLLSRLPDANRTKVRALWRDLQQQAAACQSANEYNGTLMNMQREILTGVLNAGEPENWLYQDQTDSRLEK